MSLECKAYPRQAVPQPQPVPQALHQNAAWLILAAPQLVFCWYKLRFRKLQTCKLREVLRCSSRSAEVRSLPVPYKPCSAQAVNMAQAPPRQARGRIDSLRCRLRPLV